MDIKRKYLFFKESINDFKFNRLNQIRYYNFWTTQLAREIWFTQFIEQHDLLKNHRGKVNFYSVLGSLETLRHRSKGINIFFSGENMQAERFSEYKQICEEQPFDLSLGFDYREGENYLRFPLWIMSLFDPRADYQAIKLRVKQLSEIRYDNRTGFCALVASHDWNGIRGQMIDSFSEIDTVNSGGCFRKNTDDLVNRYDNNKYEFIKQYKFNICPENSSAPGYVTEKIFQSIEAGCIPIYWGANNKPEEDILNQDVIVCWNKDGDNSSAFQFIRELHLDSELYQHFMEQSRLLPNAEDKIWEYYLDLKQRFTEIF
jgi:hypothetical protein